MPKQIKKKEHSVFAQIKAGLEDAVAHAKGELNLRTVELPAPPPEYDLVRVQRLRKKLNMSQSVFAATMNVSRRTVQSWEQGIRTPSDSSLRLLEVFELKPEIARNIMNRV